MKWSSVTALPIGRDNDLICCVLTVISQNKSVDETEGTIEDHVNHQFFPNKFVNGSPPSSKQFPEDTNPGGENFGVICDRHDVFNQN